jgi:FkbM family methyltransferase
MDPLVQALITTATARLGTVIHIGAGASAGEDYAGAAVGALWLVEGDPETAGDLLATTAAHPAARVRQAVVLPLSAETTWYRYNLRSMNGPRSAEALKGLYPRLRESSKAVGYGAGVQELLEEILNSNLPDGNRALVLDVAGQEGDLLRALSDDLLQCFEWIATRCAGPATATGWTGPQVAAARLARCHFAARSAADPTDTPWPITVFHFDAISAAHAKQEALKIELDALSAQHAELQSKATWRAQQILELAHERDRFKAKYEQERSRAESIEAELARAQRQVAEVSNERTSLDVACDQAREGVDAARVDGESRLALAESARRESVERLGNELHSRQQEGTEPAVNPARTHNEAAPPSPDRLYYGLNELDRKLEAYLDFDNGYFVELGANDGIAQSNTLYFEKQRGWRGVLIEPILHNFLKCRSNRAAENHFECAACVSFAHNKAFVTLAYSNLMTTPIGLDSDIEDPRSHAESGRIYIPKGESVVDVLARASTLSSILDEAGAPTVIDLLSLDVEGAEMEVLRGINHERHRFRYILVECRAPERLTLYLAEHGYHLVDKLSVHDYLFGAR